MPQRQHSDLQALHQQLTCFSAGCLPARSQHRLLELQHVHQQELLLLQPCLLGGQHPVSHTSEAAIAGSKLRLQLMTCGRANRGRAADIRKGTYCLSPSIQTHDGTLQPPELQPAASQLSHTASSSSLNSLGSDEEDPNDPHDLKYYKQLYDVIHLFDSDDEAGDAPGATAAGDSRGTDAVDSAAVAAAPEPTERAGNTAYGSAKAGAGAVALAAAASAAEAAAAGALWGRPLAGAVRKRLRRRQRLAEVLGLMHGQSPPPGCADGIGLAARCAAMRPRVKWLAKTVLEAGSPLHALLRHPGWRQQAAAVEAAVRRGDAGAPALMKDLCIYAFAAADLAADGAALSDLELAGCAAYNEIGHAMQDRGPMAFHELRLPANAAARLALLRALLHRADLVPSGAQPLGGEHQQAVAAWAVSELAVAGGGSRSSGELAALLEEHADAAGVYGSDGSSSSDDSGSSDDDSGGWDGWEQGRCGPYAAAAAAPLPPPRHEAVVWLHARSRVLLELAITAGRLPGHTAARELAELDLWSFQVLREALPELPACSRDWHGAMAAVVAADAHQQAYASARLFAAAQAACVLAVAGVPLRDLTRRACLQYYMLWQAIEELSPASARPLMQCPRTMEGRLCQLWLLQLLQEAWRQRCSGLGGGGGGGPRGSSGGGGGATPRLRKAAIRALAAKALACRFGAGGGGAADDGNGDDVSDVGQGRLLGDRHVERAEAGAEAGAGAAPSAPPLPRAISVSSGGSVCMTPDLAPRAMYGALAWLFSRLGSGPGHAGSFTAVGGPQMLLALATINTACQLAVAEPGSCYVWQPVAIAEHAASVLTPEEEAGPQEAVFPPPPGATAAVELTRLGTRLPFAEAKRAHLASCTKPIVSVSSRRSAALKAALKDAERRLVAKREGALQLEARGVAGLEAALLLVAKLREALAKEGRDACAWVRGLHMRWDSDDEAHLYERVCMDGARKLTEADRQRVEAAKQRSAQFAWMFVLHEFSTTLPLGLPDAGGGSGGGGAGGGSSGRGSQVPDLDLDPELMETVVQLQADALSKELLPVLQAGSAGGAEGADVAGSVMVDLQVAECVPGLSGQLVAAGPGACAAAAAPSLRAGGGRKVGMRMGK